MSVLPTSYSIAGVEIEDQGLYKLPDGTEVCAWWMIDFFGPSYVKFSVDYDGDEHPTWIANVKDYNDIDYQADVGQLIYVKDEEYDEDSVYATDWHVRDLIPIEEYDE